MAEDRVTLSANDLEVSVGIEDTQFGVKLGIDDEPFWRVHITPQGQVLVGTGFSLPEPLAGGGGGGDVATDAIWNAVGDLVVATGNNTAVRLPKGAEGTFLRAGAVTAAWAVLADADIPAAIARDSEVATAVSNAITALVDGAPGTLNTLDKLAAAVNDDPDFAATFGAAVAAAMDLKANITYVDDELAALTTEDIIHSLFGTYDITTSFMFALVVQVIARNADRVAALESLAGLANFDVAAETTVVTEPERVAEDLPNWPDGTMGFVQVGADIIGFGPDSRWEVGEDPDPFLGTVTTSFADQPQIDGGDIDDTYAAGGPVWKHTDDTLLMVYHAEQEPVGIPAGAFYSYLGLARSLDDGATWTALGHIIDPNIPPSATSNVDVGSGGYVTDGTYFYVYFKDVVGASFATGYPVVGVARTTLTAMVDAAEDGTLPVFDKFYDGGWAEDGLGGLTTDVCPFSAPVAWLDVIYLTDKAKYLMVYSTTTVISPQRHWEIQARLADDVEGPWSAPERIIAPTLDEILYVTLSGPDMGAQKDVPLNDLFLFFTRAEDSEDRWDTATLQRAELTWNPASAGDAILRTDYNAQTVLRAIADDDPTPLTMGASTILARLASGDIKAATPAELRTLLAVPLTTYVDSQDALYAGVLATFLANGTQFVMHDLAQTMAFGG